MNVTKVVNLQLVKDVKFLLALMPDIKRDQIDLRVFAAFPENETDGLFCQECSQYILSKEDFSLASDDLAMKMSTRSDILQGQAQFRRI